jgi:hypothetical protein
MSNINYDIFQRNNTQYNGTQCYGLNATLSIKDTRLNNT